MTNSTKEPLHPELIKINSRLAFLEGQVRGSIEMTVLRLNAIDDQLKKLGVFMATKKKVMKKKVAKKAKKKK